MIERLGRWGRRRSHAERHPREAKAVHDRLTLAIALAAIVLFTVTAGTVLPHLLRAWNGEAASPDLALTNALLLNVALILLGWHRYKALSAELTARRISEEKMRQLAEEDHLTGSLNRRSFTQAASVAIAREASSATRSLAAIAIDLDNFKQVNDLNGHATGDAVLKEVVSRIAAVLPGDAIFARLGGDEFACLLPFDAAHGEQVDHFATLLIERISAPIQMPGVSIEVTLSLGIAASADLSAEERRDGNSERLMHRADIAMYQAKKKGKNRFFWFEKSMETELRFRNQLEAGIRKGIANGEFVPFYEQQIDLDTGTLTGFEMLARWDSPEMGLIGPDIFIPIAEDIGAIAEMSEALISQAFEDAKAWAEHLSLSVNISPVQMRDPWFAQKILKLLVQHRFPPHRLEIEVTESCLHENIGLVRSMITSLQNQGVRISLDDFGVGYSSLSQLRSLPFDRLKIDKSFVGELRRKDESAKLVDAIVAMGRGLKMPVTAEGIEDADVLEALRKMGQMKGQGYHYGRPEPADAVRARLADAGLLYDADGSPAVHPLSRVDTIDDAQAG